MTTYDDAVREALKQGPGSVKQIAARIPRASEGGVRRTIYLMSERGEARITHYAKIGSYTYTAIWEAVE